MSNNHLRDDPVLITAGVLEEIGRHLLMQRNFHISSYKDAYVKRRIGIRIRTTSSQSIEAYLDLLLHDENELDMLLKVLKIHVSQFFRNPSTFEKLHLQILPEVFALKGREGRDALMIWSVGCARGEEPYSVAMMVHRHFGEEWKAGRITIEATDVDAGILEKARRGTYRAERLVDVPEEMRNRYFTKKDGRYHLSSEIRDMVNFRQSDLSRPNDFIPSDLILCRNVLIYFERWQQLRITGGFEEYLRPGGFLVLGQGETVLHEHKRSFETVCPTERIYRRL